MQGGKQLLHRNGQQEEKFSHYSSMLKHYIELKKNEGFSKDTEKDLGVEPVKVGVGIRETEEEYSVNDNDLLEWARCHQKEDIWDIQFIVH